MKDRHSNEELVTLTLTQKQAEAILKCVDGWRIKGERGALFAAWKKLRVALGIWNENNQSNRVH